jgi:hypothetical protein
MNIWMTPLVLGLTLILPLTPSVAEAPMHQSATSEASFDLVGEGGFSYRWAVDDARHKNECQLYDWCVFADIVGPRCPNEVFVALEFYDKHGDIVTGGGDILPGSNRQRFISVEVGTSRDITFSTLNVVDVLCGLGLPTGHANL